MALSLCRLHPARSPALARSLTTTHGLLRLPLRPAAAQTLFLSPPARPLRALSISSKAGTETLSGSSEPPASPVAASVDSAPAPLPDQAALAGGPLPAPPALAAEPLPPASPQDSARMALSSARQSASSLIQLIPEFDAARAREGTLRGLHAVNNAWTRYGSVVTVAVGATVLGMLSSQYLTAATIASFKAGALSGGLGIAASYAAYARYLAIDTSQAVDAVIARLQTDSRVVSKFGVDIIPNKYVATSGTAAKWSLRAPESAEPLPTDLPLGSKLAEMVSRRFQPARLQLVFGVGSPQAAQPRAVASAEVTKENGRLLLSALVLDFPETEERWVLEGDALAAADLFRPGLSIFGR